MAGAGGCSLSAAVVVSLVPGDGSGRDHSSPRSSSCTRPRTGVGRRGLHWAGRRTQLALAEAGWRLGSNFQPAKLGARLGESGAIEPGVMYMRRVVEKQANTLF